MQPLIDKLILILLCLFYIQLQSQEKIINVSKDDGLTSTTVTTSHVGSKGVVWIGTINGLNAYTGSKWVPIKHIEDSKSGHIKPLGIIHSIFEDLNANIWISSENGIFLYNRKFWTFYEPEGDKDYIVKEFFQDRSGAIWVTQEYLQDLTNEMGFSMVSGKLQKYSNYRWYKFDDDVAGTVPLRSKEHSRYFSKFIQDKQGNIWFATLEGLFMFDGRKWFSYKEEEIDAIKTYDVFEDMNGQIWTATENGVSRKNKEKWENFSRKEGLSDNYCYRILEDPMGRIWAFSKNGLRYSGISVFNGEKWTAFNGNDVHLKGEVEEVLWVSEGIIAFSKTGVSLFNGQSWHKYSEKDGLTDKNYSLIKRDKGKGIWLAGEFTLNYYVNGRWKEIITRSEKWEVTQIYQDKMNRLWIGTNKHGLFSLVGDKLSQYAQKDGLSDDNISYIFEDRHQNIWVICRKGFCRIETINSN